MLPRMRQAVVISTMRLHRSSDEATVRPWSQTCSCLKSNQTAQLDCAHIIGRTNQPTLLITQRSLTREHLSQPCNRNPADMKANVNYTTTVWL